MSTAPGQGSVGQSQGLRSPGLFFDMWHLPEVASPPLAAPWECKGGALALIPI